MAIREMLVGLGVGMGLAYYLDPVRGRRRRAGVRDKIYHWMLQADSAIDVVSRDLSHRAQGLACEFRARMADEEGLPDSKLEARVRSALGRSSSHPSAIEVRSNQGIVALRGPILASDVPGVLAAVGSVRGVKEVQNQLDVHDRAGDVPGLQGVGRTHSAYAKTNWPPSSRFLAGALGTALMANCSANFNLRNALLGTLGFGLFLRGATNMEIGRAAGLGPMRRGIDLQKTININAPVEKVYETWTHYDNFPHFMRNVIEIKDAGYERSQWTVKGPMGTKIHWTAVVTRREPNRLFAWRTLPGSTIAHSGVIHFDRNPEGGTRVHVQMTYNPPAGMGGHLIASLFGADPKHEMDQDLLRMKSFIETGRQPHDAAHREGQAVEAMQPAEISSIEQGTSPGNCPT